MSTPIQVKIVRAGKEIGTYEAAEVLRLLGLGTLKPTDIYWHEGMGGWELLSKLDVSEGLRLPAEPEVKSQSDNESKSITWGACCGGCGLLISLICGFFSVYLFLSSRDLDKNEFYGRVLFEWVAKGLGAISLICLFIAIAYYYIRKK
ncbi:MAG: hypothetical protein ACK47U_08995 [Verrucomicrobiota bacterium]|jgi:hypothetical protein